MKRSHPGSRAVLLALLATTAIAASASVAQAGPLVSSAPSCTSQTFEQPFLPWVDPANYVLAPDGTLEDGAAGWTLSNASVVEGNEPYFVHGAGESRSLSLPAGSSATTPAMCVGVEHPTLRLFAANSGSLFSSLRVEVLFEDALGNVQSLRIGSVSAASSFDPTAQMAVVANLLALFPGERTAVAFRFTPEGDGNWRIDDVYVDPFRM